MRLAVAAANVSPSGAMATEAIRGAITRRHLSMNVSASQAMTTPSASPVRIVLPSFDHAAQVPAALCPSRGLFPPPDPAAHAHSTFLPVARSIGPVTTARLPSGATAIGIAYGSAGSCPAATRLDLIVEGRPPTTQVLTTYSRAL